ncbi:hypothetical protein JL720_9194 [Aureococcus anophagefferens]|nr:hypothetical protein JL720_9194 [Aureococcus anophagefferens]
MATGDVAIDDSWAYHHVKAASDTHVVCDWAGVDERRGGDAGVAVRHLPGHGELDLLPFDDLLPGNAAPAVDAESRAARDAAERRRRLRPR